MKGEKHEGGSHSVNKNGDEQNFGQEADGHIIEFEFTILIIAPLDACTMTVLLSMVFEKSRRVKRQNTYVDEFQKMLPFAMGKFLEDLYSFA